MNVHQVLAQPSPALAQALAEFERPFAYPLGDRKSFHISHGDDYTRFFRAQGDGACFVAERQGRVVGTLGTAIRNLWCPDGQERSVAYFGDLKIAEGARGGVILARLARAAQAWLEPKVAAGFGVVMGGTTVTPNGYTGRIGLPPFRELGRVVVLRITGSAGPVPGPGREPVTTDPATGLACYRHLSAGRYACPAGQAAERSEITPSWLKLPDGSACGMLEDTRKAKRLIMDDGSEMVSAHLSCFASNTPAAGACLINAAFRQAALAGFPGLFVTVSEPDASALGVFLRGLEILQAPAVVYGAGLAPGVWNINGAEI